MNIYFSGIGGSGLSPLAQLVDDAGHQVFGSDNNYDQIDDIELQKRQISVSSNQDGQFLEKTHRQHPIDWLIYTSALPADHPELVMAKKLGIKATKRDQFIPEFIKQHNFKLIAIAGTHGKTSTTTMTIWLFEQLGIPASYLVGSTLPFGSAGKYAKNSQYFIYECDEYDKNFLHYYPDVALIPGLDHDHIDIYPTLESYQQAFKQFFKQSQQVILWQDNLAPMFADLDNLTILNQIAPDLKLLGHDKNNASLIIKMLKLFNENKNAWDIDQAIKILNRTPRPGRRFEQLAPNLISDYAHHPTEIKSTINLAREYMKQHQYDKLTIVYQPHHNERQLEFKDAYQQAFAKADQILWLPTYLARVKKTEQILSAQELTKPLNQAQIAKMNQNLIAQIQQALKNNHLVVAMTAGDLDHWLRHNLKQIID